MRAPMIPGRKPEDNDQREAMLRRLGIAEEKPRTSSRWDVLAGRDMEPAAPVQTRPPVVDEVAAEEPLAAHQPIPMTVEALRIVEPAPEPVETAPEPVVVQAPMQPVAREPEPEPTPEPVVVQAPIQPVAREPEPEPVVEAPVARAPEPEPVVEAPVARAPEPEAAAPSMNGASFMPGWGEESIPEDEEVEAFDEPEAPVEAAAPVEPVVHQPRWMDEPVAEAPRREELLPKMERPVSFTPSVASNDEDLEVAPEPEAEAPEAPVMQAFVEPEPVIEPPVARAPIIEPAAPIEFPVARQPAPEPEPEPVVEAPVVRDPFTPPAPAPVVEAPVLRQSEPEPEPVVEPEPVIRRQPEPEPEPDPVVEEPVARRPEPEPAPAAPPVDAALQEMRAELAAMRKQFQTAPQPQPQPQPQAQPAAPFAATIPYESRRKTKQDVFANARMVVWTLGIVAALWVTFHAMQASSQHQAKQDHIMATMTGKDADTADKADQNKDN